MSYYPLLMGLVIAVIGPLLALRYLRGILLQVVDQSCAAPGSSELWWRTVVILALTGSVLLMLMFGPRDASLGFAEFLRRTLLLATLSVFLSVSFVARSLWNRLSEWLRRQTLEKPAPRPFEDRAKT